MAEGYPEKKAALAGKGGKDKAAYGEMGGAKVSGERKGAKLDSAGDVKSKDDAAYKKGCGPVSKEAGA